MVARSSWGGEMRRSITCLVMLIFFVGPSVAAVRAGDSGISPSKTDNEPAAKSDESTRTEAPADERPAIESEMQQLRELVQSQAEELNDLRTRLAAVEAGGAASKEAPASTAPPASIFQPSTSAAIASV